MTENHTILTCENKNINFSKQIYRWQSLISTLQYIWNNTVLIKTDIFFTQKSCLSRTHCTIELNLNFRNKYTYIFTIRKILSIKLDHLVMISFGFVETLRDLKIYLTFTLLFFRMKKKQFFFCLVKILSCGVLGIKWGFGI